MNSYSVFAVFLLAVAGNGAAAQTSDSLWHYTEVAVRDNPGIKAAYHAYRSTLGSIPAAGALDDPLLEVGIFPRPLEYVDGKEVARLQVMQMFPWFGTRAAARAEASAMARMTFEEYRESVDKLRGEVATSWYALCLLRQRQVTNEEQRQLLEQLERLALQRFAAAGNFSTTTPTTTRQKERTTATNSMTGMGMKAVPAGGKTDMGTMSSNMADAPEGLSSLLLLQLERAEAESEAAGIASEMIAGKAAFNVLLDRHADSPLVLPDTCILTAFDLDIEKAMNTISERNPMLGMIREEQRAAKEKGNMARKMGYPMLGVGLQYMVTRPAGQSMTGHAGGMDMVMPMVTVSLPIMRGKYRAAREDALQLQRASEERYRDTYRRIETELYRLRHLLDQATRDIQLAREQARLVRTNLEIALGRFAAGDGSLDELLQVRRQLSGYKLNELSAIIDYNSAVAAVQQLLSTPNP